MFLCRCSRWHQDWYAGRFVISYTGASTWVVEDKDARLNMIEDSAGLPDNIADPLIVPDFDSIIMPGKNSVVLMKGNTWPGIEYSRNAMGLCHKAPTMKSDAQGQPLQKRLMLKVDLAHAEE